MRLYKNCVYLYMNTVSKFIRQDLTIFVVNHSEKKYGVAF